MSLEPFDEFIRRIRELVRSLEESASRLETTRREFIEPLYSVYEYTDRYVIVVDMPMADFNVLSVDLRGRRLSLECRLRSDVRFERWSMHRTTGFKYYRLELQLPEDVVP